MTLRRKLASTRGTVCHQDETQRKTVDEILVPRPPLQDGHDELTTKRKRWAPEEFLRTLIESETTAHDASDTPRSLPLSRGRGAPG